MKRKTNLIALLGAGIFSLGLTFALTFPEKIEENFYFQGKEYHYKKRAGYFQEKSLIVSDSLSYGKGMEAFYFDQYGGLDSYFKESHGFMGKQRINGVIEEIANEELEKAESYIKQKK
ncbi:hypothetical protein GW932_01805 [archaeon]|nr:hypothetical protein [archaeon]